MASKEKKIKSSKTDEKSKSSKKGEDITIVVDGSSESGSPTKAELVLPDDAGSETKPSDTEDAAPADELLSELPPSDASKLTEIIVEKYEGEMRNGQYDGQGKAWFKNGNYYEGEFVQGLMHGGGRFVWADGQVYMGEFTNNCVTGKGEYQWPDGSRYSGDVMNGLRHGSGSMWCQTGETQSLSYTGDWAYGKRHGKGHLNYNEDGSSCYEGDWVNNIRHGHGTRQYPSGNIYKGMWFNNFRHGEGTMKWVDSNQMYIGQWEDGIQHGLGQHVWFVHRVIGSQYTLRNTYNGEFVKGVRHGYGTFYYANGAKYEGYWQNNMKHGKGRFTFKNGRYYEGQFDYDHIKEFPDFQMDGNLTPDPNSIRTRTPLPLDSMSVHSNISENTLGPGFQIDLTTLIKPAGLTCEDADARQVANVIKRHMSALKKLYDFYSSLGYYDSSDNTFILSHMQFLRLLTDCNLHHKHLTLLQMDQLLVYETEELQNPHDRILFREFVNHIIALSVHLYGNDFKDTDGSIRYQDCVNHLINVHVLKYACKIKGHFFHEARRAIHALEYLDDAFQVYRSLCQQIKKTKGHALKMRDFLYLMRDLQLINEDLTARHIIQELTRDNPNATDDCDGYNLELEITFLEFFETLVACAQNYVTDAQAKDSITPNPNGDIAGQPQTSGADQMSLASEGTSGPSIAPNDNDDDGEGKSSAPPNMTPRTTTPGAPIASASQGDRHSSVAQTMSRAKVTDAIDSARDHVLTKRQSLAQAASMTPVVGKVSSTQAGPSDGLEEAEKTMDMIVESDFNLPDASVVDPEHSEELDDTRKFNFWTYQLYFFFGMKFFPAYQNYTSIKQMIALRLKNPFQKPNHPANCICRNEDQSHLLKVIVPESPPVSQPVLSPANSVSATVEP